MAANLIVKVDFDAFMSPFQNESVLNLVLQNCLMRGRHSLIALGGDLYLGSHEFESVYRILNK